MCVGERVQRVWRGRTCVCVEGEVEQRVDREGTCEEERRVDVCVEGGGVCGRDVCGG